MFCKIYREDSVLVRVRVWLSCEGKGEIEFQGYDEVGVTLMVMVRGHIPWPGLGLMLGVR